MTKPAVSIVALLSFLSAACAYATQSADSKTQIATNTDSAAPMNSCPAGSSSWPIYKSLNVESTEEIATSLASYRMLEGEFRFCNAGGFGLDARLMMDSSGNRAGGFVFCGEAVGYADNGITLSTQAQAKSDSTSRKSSVFEWYYSDQSPRSMPQSFTNTYNDSGRQQYIVGEVLTGYARAVIGSDPLQVQQECLKMTQALADERAADVLKQRNAHLRP